MVVWELGSVWESSGEFRKGSGEHLEALRSIWKSLRQLEGSERALQSFGSIGKVGKAGRVGENLEAFGSVWESSGLYYHHSLQ